MANLTHTFSLSDLPRFPDKYDSEFFKRTRNSTADKEEQCLQTCVTSPAVHPSCRPKLSPANNSIAASLRGLSYTL